jgi:Cellulose binding domain
VTVRRLLIAALAALCAVGLAVVGGGTAHAAVNGCTGTFQVGLITFDRPSVTPGQSFTATAPIQNCTDQTQTLNGYWLAQSTPPPGAPSTFCAGNDPFPISQVSVAPGGTYTAKVTYDISSTCTAPVIRVSAVVNGSPNVTQSATIPVSSGTACAGTFQMTPITLDRTSVTPGGHFTATTTIQNCTAQTQTPNGYWDALGASTDPYSFCTASDPDPMTAPPIAPGGTYTSTVTYDVASQCTATTINVAAVIYGSPNVTQRADLPVSRVSTTPPSTCMVTYHNDSEWSTGFVAQVTITNRGTASIAGWSLTFNFPGDQRVTNSWGATIQQNGNAITAVNAPWTAMIAPGGSISFGMSGSWQRSDAAPTAFTLNGAACRVG